MLDTGAHLRAGRVGGLLRLTEFAIATGPAMNMALQAAFGELFLDLSAAIGAVGPHVRSRVARIKNIFRTFGLSCTLASLPRNGARICAGDRRRYGSCNRNTGVHASSSSARPCSSGGWYVSSWSTSEAYAIVKLLNSPVMLPSCNS